MGPFEALVYFIYIMMGNKLFSRLILVHYFSFNVLLLAHKCNYRSLLFALITRYKFLSSTGKQHRLGALSPQGIYSGKTKGCNSVHADMQPTCTVWRAVHTREKGVTEGSGPP